MTKNILTIDNKEETLKKSETGQEISFHKAHITEEEIEAVSDTLRSGWLTMGPKTIEFEKQFSEFTGTQYAVSMNSATACLHLSLKAIGIQAGDEVIVPTNTFIATAEVVTYLNATPVLCDITEDTHNIDVEKIESLITKKTKAIIPVHFAGNYCDMDRIQEIANKYNLSVIEDAAHALPASYKGRNVGTTADITCFSFYATKTLATGEGGMATTANPKYAENMKINRLHGINKDVWNRYTKNGSWYYEVVDNGHKYNMTDINAALGLVQLKKCQWMCDERKKIAQQYDEAFKDTSVKILKLTPDCEPSRHLYVIKVNNRNELIEKLKESGITTSVHFIPVHKHPYYKEKYNLIDSNYPIANEVFEKSLSLPIYPGLNKENIQYIINKVLKYSK